MLIAYYNFFIVSNALSFRYLKEFKMHKRRRTKYESHQLNALRLVVVNNLIKI